MTKERTSTTRTRTRTRLSIDLPTDMHRALKRLAADRDVTLHQLVVQALYTAIPGLKQLEANQGEARETNLKKEAQHVTQ